MSIHNCPCCNARVAVTDQIKPFELLATIYNKQIQILCSNCGWRIRTVEPAEVER